MQNSLVYLSLFFIAVLVYRQIVLSKKVKELTSTGTPGETNIDNEYVNKLFERTKNASQHIGLVRFNPFNDTGGDQSFSLAVCNDFGNGYIITSIHNREGTRVYAKSIIDGDSTHVLSKEEKEALRIALQ